MIIDFIKLFPLRFRIKIFYFYKFKRWINIDKPMCFSEMLQVRKLNMQDIYSHLSDKYNVREYSSNKIGDDFLIPLVSV